MSRLGWIPNLLIFRIIKQLIIKIYIRYLLMAISEYYLLALHCNLRTIYWATCGKLIHKTFIAL